MEEEKYDPQFVDFQAKYGEMPDYLTASKQPTSKTKDSSTISFLFHDKIISETQKYMKTLSNSEERFDSDNKIFSQIDFLLKNKQNVALYGYGSKLKLINAYLKYNLSEEFPLLIFYGFSAAISLNGILSTLEKFLLEWKKRYGKIELEMEKPSKSARINIIAETLLKIEELDNLFLIIHNIDGKNLMDEQTQQSLGEIAKIDKIRMLVSFDNVRYLNMIPSKARRNFKFAFLQFDTYHVYEQELGFEENLITSKEDKKIKSLTYILKSLSPNQKEIIEIIAKFLLENQEDNEITHKRLFEECVERMVVMSENQMKENLLEIIDHKVVKEKRGEGGKILYTMDYPVNVLNKIVNKEIIEEIV